MMSYRILPAALLLCTLAAACGESPTGSDAQAQPAGASYDGGFTIGSGNATAAGGTGTGTQSQEPTTTDNVERSGYTMGSGG